MVDLVAPAQSQGQQPQEPHRSTEVVDAAAVPLKTQEWCSGYGKKQHLPASPGSQSVSSEVSETPSCDETLDFYLNSDIAVHNVEKLRKGVTIIAREGYFKGKQALKLRNFWAGDRPDDWPEDVSFKDPHNGQHRPKKAELTKMLKFLKGRHLQHQHQAQGNGTPDMGISWRPGEDSQIPCPTLQTRAAQPLTSALNLGKDVITAKVDSGGQNINPIPISNSIMQCLDDFDMDQFSQTKVDTYGSLESQVKQEAKDPPQTAIMTHQMGPGTTLAVAESGDDGHMESSDGAQAMGEMVINGYSPVQNTPYMVASQQQNGVESGWIAADCQGSRVLQAQSSTIDSKTASGLGLSIEATPVQDQSMGWSQTSLPCGTDQEMEMSGDQSGCDDLTDDMLQWIVENEESSDQFCVTRQSTLTTRQLTAEVTRLAQVFMRQTEPAEFRQCQQPSDIIESAWEQATQQQKTLDELPVATTIAQPMVNDMSTIMYMAPQERCLLPTPVQELMECDG